MEIWKYGLARSLPSSATVGDICKCTLNLKVCQKYNQIANEK